MSNTVLAPRPSPPLRAAPQRTRESTLRSACQRRVRCKRSSLEWSAGYRRALLLAVQLHVTDVALAGVGAVAAVSGVVARDGVDRIQGVVAVAAEEGVVALAALDGVVDRDGAAVERVVAVPAGELLDVGPDVVAFTARPVVGET